MQWLIDGCLEYQIFGLWPPQSVIDATDGYFADEDNVANWIAERCEVGPNFKGPSAELFASWTDYAEKARLFIGNTRSSRTR